MTAPTETPAVLDPLTFQPGDRVVLRCGLSDCWRGGDHPGVVVDRAPDWWSAEQVTRVPAEGLVYVRFDGPVGFLGASDSVSAERPDDLTPVAAAGGKS